MIETIFYSLLSAGGFFSLWALLMNHHHASKRYIWKDSDHFDGKKFYNIGWKPGESFRVEEDEFFGKKQKNGFFSFCKWILHQKRTTWKQREITQVIPPERNDSETPRITFIGHATVLVQIAGKNILTDPVWSYRASPVQWAWPKRYTKPGVKLRNLPPIDIILLSHNHYDHMDIKTLKRLVRKDPNVVIYTGLGNKSYLEKYKIKNVVEMDWFDEVKNDAVDITYLPSQHFSARGITDRNKTLWGGFAWKVGEKTFYFAGDTGYGPFVDHIAKKFKDGFDYGLVPVGAYNPQWFMKSMHTNPFDGMHLQKELKIKTAIAIHFGTFPLANDGQDEPIHDLKKAKKRPEFAGQDFKIGDAGTVWELS